MPMLIAFSPHDPLTPVQPFNLSEEAVIIGRHAECAVRLDHVSISRHHAKVYNTEETWHVHDLQSRNGTYRNGVRFEAEELREGDILHIGDWSLAFTEQSWENLVAMSSWLERIRQKAMEMSVRIYLAHGTQPPSAPVASQAAPPGKVVRAKPSDILKNAGYQGTAPLPIKQYAPVNSGLKVMSAPPLPAGMHLQANA